jgi:hypothetical protein
LRVEGLECRDLLSVTLSGGFTGFGVCAACRQFSQNVPGCSMAGLQGHGAQLQEKASRRVARVS